MKIRILSDLHREFGPREIPNADEDVIILAGDIDTKLNALPWIKEFSRGIPCVYLCGNHEFYGAKLPRVTERLLESCAGTNIHLLEDSAFQIGEWTIYGCTLWTDLALHGDWLVGASFAGDCMNDYKRIRNSARGYKRLSPADTRYLHQRSMQRMRDFFETHDPKKTIVVTHHAPSALSLRPEDRAKSLSAAYASHLDEWILRYQPPLWIHGHLHHSNDYQIGATRVLSNPQGYPDAPNPEFDPALCVVV